MYMWLESIMPFENIDTNLKKWSLFDAIFGGKMKQLFDKISLFLWWNNVNPLNQVEKNDATVQQNTQDIMPSDTMPVSEKKVNAPTTSILWDMTDLAAKYPREAWAKNNNPSGITMPMSKSLRNKLDEAWIRYEVGSKRPSNEWGNYVKFATMDEWIRAKKIVLMKWNMVIRERLAKRVGHKDMASNYKYADWILKAARIDGSKRFSELTESEMDALMMKQIKQESSGLYKELLARNVTPIADNIA